MAAEGKKVLIADDEPDVHEFVKAALRKGGYVILSAADGQAAVDMAQAEKPDLVILDVQMPKKDGFQVFQELRQNAETRHIPVIMLTAVTERTGMKFDAESMGEYFGAEPDRYIDKPIDPTTLQKAASELLG